MTPPPVLYGVAERIATITLNRPDVRNALNPEALELLGESIERAEHDGEVDVMILTGADPAFCAGLDLQQLADNSNELLAAGTSVSSRDAWILASSKASSGELPTNRSCNDRERNASGSAVPP